MARTGCDNLGVLFHFVEDTIYKYKLKLRSFRSLYLYIIDI